MPWRCDSAPECSRRRRKTLAGVFVLLGCPLLGCPFLQSNHAQCFLKPCARFRQRRRLAARFHLGGIRSIGPKAFDTHSLGLDAASGQTRRHPLGTLIAVAVRSYPGERTGAITGGTAAQTSLRLLPGPEGYPNGSSGRPPRPLGSGYAPSRAPAFLLSPLHRGSGLVPAWRWR